MAETTPARPMALAEAYLDAPSNTLAPLPNVWSFGGGTQTAAIAALIIQGRLPRPDFTVMADTGREKRSTWQYLKYVLAPQLAEVGVTVEIARAAEYATKGVWGGADRKTCLLPVYTTLDIAPGEKPGKFSNWCSGEWKGAVLERYLREKHGIRKRRIWIGISTNEMKRVRVRGKDGNPRYHPLIETVPLSRAECVELVLSMGWPMPPRSSCAECPNQQDDEWNDTRLNSPDEFARAVAFDAEIRQTDPHVFLHQSGIPLGEVDFDARIKAAREEAERRAALARLQGTFDMFGDKKEGCDSGYCFT